MKHMKKLGVLKGIGSLILIIGLIALVATPIYLFIQAAVLSGEFVNKFWIVMDIVLGASLIAFLLVVVLILMTSAREKN
jgi:hypothetical protein